MQYPIKLKMSDGTEKTFWLADEKLQFGGTDDGVSDVQINGSSIVSDGVAEIPVATMDMAGVVKINPGTGISIDPSNNIIFVNKASVDQITNRTVTNRPITPDRLNPAVKATLTDSNKIVMTDTEKAAACKTLGAVYDGEMVKLFEYTTVGGESQISIEADENGNPLKLLAARVKVNCESISESLVSDSYSEIYHNSNVFLNMFSDFNSTNRKFSWSDFYIKHGEWIGEFAFTSSLLYVADISHINWSRVGVQNFEKITSANTFPYITKISRRLGGGKTFPAGVKITFYGVWKTD